MNIKGYLITSIVVLLVGTLFYVDYFYNQKPETASSLFKVYLQGEELGYIDSDEELYNLINDEQKEIKDTYSVDNVYPPSDFDIVKINTYNENITDINTIYDQIEEYDDFTIYGWTFTIKSTDEEKEDVIINVLDEKLFDEAIDTFINAFIEAEIYSNYQNGTQEEIVEYGEYIKDMYFAENVSRKRNYISANDKIYTNADELSQYLLFGPDATMNSYTVNAGDTISSIAYNNQLNPKEFLVANPELRDPDILLAIGSEVNVTLLDPVLNFVYEVEKTEEVEVNFITTTVVDNTKPVGYSEPTVAGVTGLQKVTSNYSIVNGLQSKEVDSSEPTIIREVVNAVTTVGPSYVSSTTLSNYVYTGLSFALPTLPGAIVTSPYGEWRDGYVHKGTDFSGIPGGSENSPIFAIADGTVVQAGWGSGGQGNYVVIAHAGGYYSTYMHMYNNSIIVSAGQTVVAGQQIGGMGNTGWSFGTHLHLEFTYGQPYKGGNVIYYNAYNIIYGG